MDRRELREELMREGFLPCILPDQYEYDELTAEQKYAYSSGEQFGIPSGELTDSELQLAVNMRILKYVKKVYAIAIMLLTVLILVIMFCVHIS